MTAVPAIPDFGAPMQFASTITVQERVVVLGQLADLSALPAAIRSQVQGLAVLKIPLNSRSITVSVQQLDVRLGRMAPVLKPWLPKIEGQVAIRYHRPDASVIARTKGCVKIVRGVSPDGVPTAKDFEPAACTESIQAGLRFDRRTGVMRARRLLKPGELLPTPASDLVAGIAPGEMLLIEASSGPVRVQRRVEAIQPGRPGRRLFARTADGAVLSIPYPETAP